MDNQRTENLTREQMLAFLQALDEEPNQNAAGFIRLALSTGMRKGALMALQWTDIDFERGFIILRGELAKNTKTERIPLSVAARAVLECLERTGAPSSFPAKAVARGKILSALPGGSGIRRACQRTFAPARVAAHLRKLAGSFRRR